MPNFMTLLGLGLGGLAAGSREKAQRDLEQQRYNDQINYRTGQDAQEQAWREAQAAEATRQFNAQMQANALEREAQAKYRADALLPKSREKASAYAIKLANQQWSLGIPEDADITLDELDMLVKSANMKSDNDFRSLFPPRGSGSGASGESLTPILAPPSPGQNTPIIPTVTIPAPSGFARARGLLDQIIAPPPTVPAPMPQYAPNAPASIPMPAPGLAPPSPELMTSGLPVLRAVQQWALNTADKDRASMTNAGISLAEAQQKLTPGQVIDPLALLNGKVPNLVDPRTLTGVQNDVGDLVKTTEAVPVWSWSAAKGFTPQTDATGKPIFYTGSLVLRKDQSLPPGVFRQDDPTRGIPQPYIANGKTVWKTPGQRDALDREYRRGRDIISDRQENRRANIAERSLQNTIANQRADNALARERLAFDKAKDRRAQEQNANPSLRKLEKERADLWKSWTEPTKNTAGQVTGWNWKVNTPTSERRRSQLLSEQIIKGYTEEARAEAKALGLTDPAEISSYIKQSLKTQGIAQ